MRVLLIALINTHGTWVPLNLLYLAGTLDANGIDCTVVDQSIVGTNGVFKEVYEGQYDIVGLSVLTDIRWGAFDMARVVRKLSPRSKIVMGGVHATLMPEQCKKYCDVVIKGDGEGPFLDLCQGKEPRPRFLPIDEIPFPAWHKIDLFRYPARGVSKYDRRRVNGIKLHKTPRISIQATRSCQSHCRFCSSWYVQGPYRMRSPKLVVDEMELLYNRGIRSFYFNDDSFYLDRTVGIDFCRELIRRDLEVAFHIETRADVLDLEYARWLKAAGCYRVQVGVETGSDAILAQMHKDTDTEAVYEGIRNCRKAGLRVEALMIIGNEGETDETIEETRRFLRKAKPHTVTSTWDGLLLFPGTAVYRRAVKEGMITDAFWDTREKIKAYKFTPEQLHKWNARIASYTMLSRLRYWVRQL